MTIPLGLCQCGCGQQTTVVDETGNGYRKGEYRRFVVGHNATRKPPFREPRLCAVCKTPFIATSRHPQQRLCSSNACLSTFKRNPVDHPSYVRVGKSRREHVVVAERALGRPLAAPAEVHHVNGHRRDNANRNLVICQDHEYHMLLHVRARVARAGGNPNTDRICPRCTQCKPLTEFGGGRIRAPYCKPCAREWDSLRRLRHPRRRSSVTPQHEMSAV